ncbi:MAG: hypothetical protein RL235_1149 [Chlamydiota bacterium]|jgi:nucleoside-diphosphate-sugar epimerase
MNNAAIIGCGYIGSAVAGLWHSKGFHVTATTRNPLKLKQLSKVAQKCVVLKGPKEEEFIPLIAHNDLILVSIAADSVHHYQSAYLDIAQLLRRIALEIDKPCSLIYTSSSSVYGDHHGQWVDETSALKGGSDTARILIDTEETYLSLAEVGWDVTILRLAEIYGPHRLLSERAKELAGQTLPGSGANYTNMAHRDDCAAAVEYAARHRLTGIYNIADDDHPTRKELYDALTNNLQLPSVTWDPKLASLDRGNKRVSNHKIKGEGFTFHHPHRVI